jgi:flagellar motor switch protein FliN/FliY
MTGEGSGEAMDKMKPPPESATVKLGDRPDAPRPEAVARPASFAEVQPAPAGGDPAPLGSLLGVKVVVTAELGRHQILIGDVLKLGPGSVVLLDRSVSEPVDLMVQGVCLARGEVVVVEDRFGVRIKEIVGPKS